MRDIHIPKGIALAIKSILGIDPEAFQKQFVEASDLLKNTLTKFDTHLNALTNEVSTLSAKIERLTNEKSSVIGIGSGNGAHGSGNGERIGSPSPAPVNGSGSGADD